MHADKVWLHLRESVYYALSKGICLEYPVGEDEMADTGELRETSLPQLADWPLSQLESIHPEALRESVRLLRDRLKKDHEPINSFNATI